MSCDRPDAKEHQNRPTPIPPSPPPPQPSRSGPSSVKPPPPPVNDPNPVFANSFQITQQEWRHPESNRKPPACKAGALPIELRPRIWRYRHYTDRKRPLPVELSSTTANSSSVEAGARDAPQSQPAQNRGRVRNLTSDSRDTRPDASPGQQFLNEHSQHRGGRHRRPLFATKHHGINRAMATAADLDPDGAVAGFGVRTTHHRQTRRRPVSSRRADPGRDSSSIGKHRLQQHRIDERRPVAIHPADRVRKPAQFTPGPADEWFPPTVSPIPAVRAQRRVMLPSAGRTGSASFRHVNLVDHIERSRRMDGE